MAKDGTNRGGARIGSGQKKKPLADKIAEGNPGKRKLEIIDFQNTADLKGRKCQSQGPCSQRCKRMGKP